MRNISRFFLSILVEMFVIYQCSALAYEAETEQTAKLYVDASASSARKIPETLFGLFFEEINHAGAGGLWAELVDNRGFEKWGPNTPSFIEPWVIIGDDSYLLVSTDRSSCFERNKVALRMDVSCDNIGPNPCPFGGVGIWNPGFWGMNIEQGKAYKVVFYLRALQSVNVSVSFTSSDGSQTHAIASVIATNVSNWSRAEALLEAQQTDHYSRLQLTTSSKGVIWFDQISAMPVDTYKGHGFRTDLFNMIADLNPGFLRFPGGCFVEGEQLQNAVRWEATVGPWEERPGHTNDVWRYWTDDGLGHFEFLQLAEDLGALPVWVFNNGISHLEQVDPSRIGSFVLDILNGIEFARGDPGSTWGSLRAKMGHVAPFDLRYVAIGNEDCDKPFYRGNYMKFYNAIKAGYPDIKIISNCDGSYRVLDHPADLYDYHTYRDARTIFSLAHAFDHTSRAGPKAFVSEYAVNGPDAGSRGFRGSLLAALAEAGFLIGLEKNSDIVEMASYAPLFVNENDRRWSPDAIVFDTYRQYGTPSYWMQHFFKESNGAILLQSTLQTNFSSSLIASAIHWQDPKDADNYLRIKAVNFGSSNVSMKISIDGLDKNLLQSYGSKKTLLSSNNVMDENTFQEPRKVVPWQSQLEYADTHMEVMLTPHSFTSFDLLISQYDLKIQGDDPLYKSST